IVVTIASSGGEKNKNYEVEFRMTQSPVPAAGTDRASQRQEEKRQRLLSAARKLFVPEGYHETRRQAIAGGADVAHCTVYSHCTDKREIFLAFADSALEDMLGYVYPRIPPVDTFEDYIRFSLTAIQEFSEQNPGLLRSALVDTRLLDPKDTSSKEIRNRFA